MDIDRSTAPNSLNILFQSPGGLPVNAVAPSVWSVAWAQNMVWRHFFASSTIPTSLMQGCFRCLVKNAAHIVHVLFELLSYATVSPTVSTHNLMTTSALGQVPDSREVLLLSWPSRYHLANGLIEPQQGEWRAACSALFCIPVLPTLCNMLVGYCAKTPAALAICLKFNSR